AMMDIDRISYIFGSFARRRQSHEAGSPKRRSIEPPKKAFHDRSKSAPHQSRKTTMVTSPRAKSTIGLPVDEAKFKCPMCRRQYSDPRVIPCLHTFCLRCLQEMERREFTTWYDVDVEGQQASTNNKRQSTWWAGSERRAPGCSVRFGVREK
ncbi:hypothetical protein NQ318_019719, partial [Aromia moschata]